MATWVSMNDQPGGAGGQVWVAYPNPNHPDGWNLRVQWTPIISEHAVEPLFWCPCERPDPPPKGAGEQAYGRRMIALSVKDAADYHNHGALFPGDAIYYDGFGWRIVETIQPNGWKFRNPTLYERWRLLGQKPAPESASPAPVGLRRSDAEERAPRTSTKTGLP